MLAILNIVDGADLSVNVTDQGLTIVQGTRVAQVKNLSVGNTPDTALNGAVDFVASLYPLGLSYSSAFPQGIVTGYQGLGITGEIAKVRILYSTPQYNRGTSPFILTDDTSEQDDKTTVSPKDLTPLSVKFTDPNDASNNIGPDLVEVDFPSVIRTVVLQGYYRGSDLDPFRAQVNKVNSDTFLGLQPGYWRFVRLSDSTPLYNNTGQYTWSVKVELKSRVTRNWASFGILRDSQTGRYVNIRANVMQGLKSQPYSYGIIQTVNGAILVGCYDVTPFAQLFGIGGTSSAS